MAQAIQTPVAGVSFGDRQAIVADLQTGDPVVLRREPTNPYDINAIQVLSQAGQLIGFVPRALASRIAPSLDDRGGAWHAEVVALPDWGPGSLRGVQIAFVSPENELTAEPV
jgi:single-stranded-DNA-specific exonuclease